MRLLVGPVVGRVTDSSARVLVEMSDNSQVTISLKTKAGDVVRETQAVIGKLPTIFVFNQLKPSTSYEMTVTWPGKEPNNLNGVGNIQTFGNVRDANRTSRIGVVSCNSIFVTKRAGHKDVWIKLFNQVATKKVDLIFHIGDQVYADNDFYKVMNKKMTLDEFLASQVAKGETSKWGNAVKLVQSTPHKSWPSLRPTIEEMFREIYRETWAWPQTRFVLANTSNIMMGDDHELRDDWATSKDDYDRNGLDFFIGSCAYTVMRQYQSILLSDSESPDPLSQHIKDHFVLPDLIPSSPVRIGALGLDVRFKLFRQPTWPYDNPNESFPLLGSQQWEDIIAALKPGGTLDNVDRLLIVSPLPLVFMSEGVTQFTARIVNDAEGLWTAERNIPELIKLMNLLGDWRERNMKRGGDVVVISGDIHFGAVTSITHKKRFVCHQLTSSAISNDKVPAWKGAISCLAINLDRKLNNDYAFQHRRLQFRNHFGIVTVKPRGRMACRNFTNQFPNPFQIVVNW